MTDDLANDLLPGESGVVTTHRESITERRFAAGDDAAGAAVVAMALVASFVRKAASNGTNIVSTMEVDPAFSQDFEDCMGQATYIVRVEGVEYGEALVTNVNGWVDIEAMRHTRIVLKWPVNQGDAAHEFGKFVSKTQPIRIELWEVQQTIYGAKAE